MTESESPTLACTLCLWEGETIAAKYRARSPSKSWHYLCERHVQLYGQKYSDLHILSANLVERLTSLPGVLRPREIKP